MATSFCFYVLLLKAQEAHDGLQLAVLLRVDLLVVPVSDQKLQ
jgi:hypothetical protein